jgi:hypothetical protein
MLGVYCFGALQTLRREFKCPGDDERDWKSNYDCEHDQSDGPIWNLKKRKDLRRNLNEQPRDHCIGNRNSVNIAPLQLGEEICEVHGFPFASF